MKDLNAEAIRIIDAKGVTDKVDWNKVESVLKEKTGIAEDITIHLYNLSKYGYI